MFNIINFSHRLTPILPSKEYEVIEQNSNAVVVSIRQFLLQPIQVHNYLVDSHEFVNFFPDEIPFKQRPQIAEPTLLNKGTHPKSRRLTKRAHLQNH